MTQTHDTTIMVLGASDPEMEAIEAILRTFDVTYVYALDREGVRVRPSTMYSATATSDDAAVLAAANTPGATVITVECAAGPGASEAWRRIGMAPGADDTACAATVLTVDHHRPGDPGYGRPPAEFLPASSIGQVAEILGEERVAVNRHSVCGTGIHLLPAGALGDDGPDDPVWCIGTGFLPGDLVLTAAADHCLGAAYRGQCPGIDPEDLLAWRIASRAAYQRRSEADVRADIEAARASIRSAPWEVLLDERSCRMIRVRDMRRPEPVAELVEASMIEGAEYISGPLIGRDGRHKFTVSGRPDAVRAWISIWAPAHGLVDVYGDPERGFGGGYAAKPLAHGE